MLHRAALIVFVVLALAACRTQAGGDFTAERRSLAAEDALRTPLGSAEILSIHQLRSGQRWFGGISGLAFDGHVVTAINDNGHWLRFSMQVDDAGRPTAFDDLQVVPLGGLDGSKDDGDAEELTAVPGGWVVCFERRHRLLFYAGELDGRPERWAAPDEFARQPGNGGVEAMTRLADGRMLLVSEEGGPDAAGWAWVGQPGAWERLSYVRTDGFQPTAAAALPDGGALILERRFTLIGGLAIRLRRVTAKTLVPGAILDGPVVFSLEPPLLLDNYEGMAVHARKDGRLVAYVVSDDNFNPLQATLLMAVLLPE